MPALLPSPVLKPSELQAIMPADALCMQQGSHMLVPCCSEGQALPGEHALSLLHNGKMALPSALTDTAPAPAAALQSVASRQSLRTFARMRNIIPVMHAFESCACGSMRHTVLFLQSSWGWRACNSR